MAKFKRFSLLQASYDINTEPDLTNGRTAPTAEGSTMNGYLRAEKIIAEMKRVLHRDSQDGPPNGE